MLRKHSQVLAERNIRLAKTIWTGLNRATLQKLRTLTEETALSVGTGDIIYLENSWYVTHTGLLRLARRKRCIGIQIQPAVEFCDPAYCRWAFKATVYKSPTCKGFVGYGDADPTNVSPAVRGAEMRVAETRAVNRALRKAYGIGICSVEELGTFSGPLPPAPASKKPVSRPEVVAGNGRHPLRDRLRQLVAEHQLDATLVKAYGADHCGVSELRQASREQIETFIDHLEQYATKDRGGLLAELGRYVSAKQEVA